MTETRQPAMTSSGILHPLLDDVVSTTKNWWLLLVAGVAWIVIAVVIPVMIGQNRQAAFQQAKADHDFQAQELELKTNTGLTREIHRLTAELHRRLMGPERADHDPTSAT